MIIKSNTYSFPFKLLAIFSILIGVFGLIFSDKYWTIGLIIIGLIPFWIIKGFDLSNDKKTIKFYKIYGFVYKSIYDRVTISDDLDYICYQKHYFSVRIFSGRRTFIPGYKSQSDYRILFINGDKRESFILKFLDYYEGYKVAKYLAKELNCKLIEKEKHDDRIEKEDNDYYIKTHKDKFHSLMMIKRLTRKNN